MALGESTNKIQCTVTSATTDYPFPYKYWEQSDLNVTIEDSTTGVVSELSLSGGDFTVTPTNGDPNQGAEIVTAVGYDDHVVTIERIVPNTSEADFSVGDGLPPASLNNAFDKATAQVQQLNDSIIRHFSHPTTDAATITYEAPSAALRAGKALGYDSSGNVTTIDLADTDSLAGNNAAGIEINTGIISATVDDTSIEFSSGDISIKDLGVDTAQLAAGAVETAKIADANVTKAKIENVADMKVLGNVSGGAAAPAEVAILDQDTMSGDSATSLATQQSIKAYVEAYSESISVQYSGASVGPLSVSTSWADLDLSATVGSNRALVILEVYDGSGNCGVMFKTKGSSILPYALGSNAGWGCAGGQVGTTDQGFIATAVTDASGIIEYYGTGTVTGINVNLLTYQVLQ